MKSSIFGFFSIMMIFTFECVSAQDYSTSTVSTKVDRRPNILLIVADDLGYSDLGAFGGEISTPTLDSLAQSGIQLSNFHVAPTCSPTRSMLLSGTDNHLAGLGSMHAVMKWGNPELLGKPGYEGYLNNRVLSMATIFRDSGYSTHMTGKWHLGMEEDQGPKARGFENSFALLEGGAGHLSSMGMSEYEPKATFREDGEVSKIPEDFYSTRFYSEKMIQYLKSRDISKPFFAYLAFTAPHWPLQAPRESIDRYVGRYKSGYREVLKQRLVKQKELGLISSDTNIDRYIRMLPDWEKLSPEEQRVAERKMEIYAAMIDDLDRNTAKIIEYLKATGEYDNTLVIFMSDNGAQAGGMPIFTRWSDKCCDNSYENMGNANSYLFPGKEWARVSTGISRGFKGQVSQGGILAPAIVNYPKAVTKGIRYDQFLSVMDILPTVLDFAGIKHQEKNYLGRDLLPSKGTSFASLISGDLRSVHSDNYVMGWELFGGKALRQGSWKLLSMPAPYGDNQWQLYNIEQDPGEHKDLASSQPERVEKMLSLWRSYVADNGVILDDVNEKIMIQPE